MLRVVFPLFWVLVLLSDSSLFSLKLMKTKKFSKNKNVVHYDVLFSPQGGWGGYCEHNESSGGGFDYFFNDLSLGSSSKSTLEDHGDPNDPRVRLKRDCVGIMAAFRLKNTPHHVIVANTHIYW
jgi:hypothetical protein